MWNFFDLTQQAGIPIQHNPADAPESRRSAIALAIVPTAPASPWRRAPTATDAGFDGPTAPSTWSRTCWVQSRSDLSWRALNRRPARTSSASSAIEIVRRSSRSYNVPSLSRRSDRGGRGSCGRRRLTTATSNLGDLGDAAETGRTCATGAPHCHPLACLICVPSRGHEWGGPRGPRGRRH